MINRLFDLDDKYMKYIIIAGIACMVIFIIFSVIDIIQGKRKNKTYIAVFSESYPQKNIMDILSSMLGIYKKKSVEYISLDKALFYLNHSIMMDYKTAFKIIEKAFTGKKVKQMHQSVLEEEKKRVTFLLEKKEGGNRK